MNSSQRKDAFLCHGYEDKPMVRSVSLGLDQYEITTWFDEAEMRPGDHLVDKISEAIDKADWFCAFLTPNSVEKDWVKFELSLAMNREIESGEIFIIPILLYNCIMPPFLRDKLYVDLRDWGNYETGLEKLVRTIKGDTAYLPKDFDISKLNDPNVSDEYILSLPRSQATLELNLRSEKWNSRRVKSLSKYSGLNEKQVINYCENAQHIILGPVINAVGDIFYGVEWKVMELYEDRSSYLADVNRYLALMSKHPNEYYRNDVLIYFFSFYK